MLAMLRLRLLLNLLWLLLAVAASGTAFPFLADLSSAPRTVGSQSTLPSSPSADGMWPREQERGHNNVTWKHTSRPSCIQLTYTQHTQALTGLCMLT